MSGVIESHSLEQTIPLADAVVIAVPVEPHERFVVIDIAPPGKKPSEEFPSFRRYLHRFRVEEVLYGTVDVGSEIEVDTASWGYLLKAHKKRYLDKIHKILRIDQYEGSLTQGDVKREPRRILLLRGNPGGGRSRSCSPVI